jgi:hypothetical protein
MCVICKFEYSTTVGQFTNGVILQVQQTCLVHQVAECEAVTTAKEMQMKHILHGGDGREIVVLVKTGMIQFMPTCLMLNELGGSSADSHARTALQQMPELLRELLQMRMLFVDVKPSNLGLLQVGSDLVLKVCQSWPCPRT